MAYFYAAAIHRSRGALWPSFAPAHITDPYDWNDWSEWLSPDIEEGNLLQTGGMLYPTASAQLGPVNLRVPNRTPFYLKSDDDALAHN